VTRHSCGPCRGRLYTSGTLRDEVIMVQAGSLDDPDLPKFEGRPARETHASS
jgi:hypothetical protein